MFCDETKVGHFAIKAEQLANANSDALFRLLVTMTMFQRRSDVQIMRILRGITKDAAAEMTNSKRLLSLATKVDCRHLATTQTLKEGCDLAKDAHFNLFSVLSNYQ